MVVEEGHYGPESHYRRINLNSIRTLAAAITTAMITCGATAATISFSATPAAQDLDINQTLNLGMFNTSLGKLTNVAMQFNVNSTYEITLINQGAEPVTGEGTVLSLFSWYSTLGALN